MDMSLPRPLKAKQMTLVRPGTGVPSVDYSVWTQSFRYVVSLQVK